VERQLAEYKNQAKSIFKSLSNQTESRMFIESKNYVFWYVRSVRCSSLARATAPDAGRRPAATQPRLQPVH